MTMKVNRRFNPAGMAAIVALAMLQGCSQINDTSDLQQYVRETQSRPAGRIDPLPEFKSYESFLYRATSLRGPFQPLVKVELVDEDDPDSSPKNNLKPDFERPKEPLEAFKLENLRMVGTIHMLEMGNLTALIKDSNGEIHRLKSGNYVGRNYGEILTVNETQLDIIEIVPNGRDGWMKRPRNLVLVEQ